MKATQAMVDAAFPHLHGDLEFRDDPELRVILEGPVRTALNAALDADEEENELTVLRAIVQDAREWIANPWEVGSREQINMLATVERALATAEALR